MDLVNALAGKYHIRVGIHDEPGKSPYDHPDSVVRAIKNRPNLDACVDIGNWVRNGVDIVSALKNQLHGHVVSVHLKDVQQSGSEHSPETILGHGVCNIAGILRELKQEGFAGFFSIEHPAGGAAGIKIIKEDVAFFYEQVSKL